MKAKKAKRQDVVQKHGERHQQPPKQDKSNNYFYMLGAAIIGLLGVIIYSDSFNCAFHFDDAFHIVNNTAIRSLSGLGSLWKHNPAMPGLSFMPYRPIPMTTFALNYHFGQLHVWPYHLVNVSIHIINALLTGWLTLLIFSSPVLKSYPISHHKKTLALFTALLFVSHPLATQSVTYIVQRMNLMATLFYLLSVILYLVARLSDKSKRVRYLLLAGSLFCAILAILSKENTVTLPFAIALIEVCFFRVKPISINFKDYRVILSIAAFLAAIIVALNISQNIFKPIAASEQNNFIDITSLNYLFTQFGVIAKYIQLLILPINQNLDYDLPISTGFFEIRTLLSLIFLLSLVATAVVLFNKHRVISFGIFWFFLTVSIESGIIPIDDLIFEHRTYLPSFGFFLILVYCVHFSLWNNYKSVAIGILVGIIGVNSILTFERNKVWESDLTLWSDALSKSPNKARPFENRGITYSALGKNEEAIKDLTTAILLSPKFAGAYCARGCAKQTLGQLEEAIKDFNTAILLDSTNSVAFNNRGLAKHAVGKNAEAISDFNAALRIKPGFAEARSNRGNAYVALGRYVEAMKDFNALIALQPEYADPFYNRGSANLGQGKTTEAINDFNVVLKLKPGFAEAYGNRGMAYAMLGKYGEAEQDLSTAIKLKPDYADAYSNLGNLHYSLKKYDEAIKDYSSAINLNPNYVQAYSNRGFAYLALQKYQPALDDLSKARQLGFTVDPNVINNLQAKIGKGAI